MGASEPEPVQSVPQQSRVSREELYERVWTEPVRTIAKRFGVSDVALAKDCKRLRIPLPGRGYWAKKAAGKSVPRIPLPALPPNDSVTPRERTFSAAAVVFDLELPGPIVAQIAFESDPANAIVVREDLRSLHPLVKATRDVLEGKVHVGSWRDARPCRLDIDVSKPQLKRALRIMDALIEAFEVRGWKVDFGAGDDRKSYVTILRQRLPFGIREMLKKVANPPAKPERLYDGRMHTPWQSKYRDEPSGVLAFVIRYDWGHGVHKSWAETKTQPLEERLSDFVISLVKDAHEDLERAQRRAESERLAEEAAERRREEERRREAEAARVRALLQQSDLWYKSRRLYDYLRAVRTAVESQPDGLEDESDLGRWFAWAEAYARSIDPLQQPLSSLPAVPPAQK